MHEKENVMPKFYLDPIGIVCNQGDEYITSVILENNKEFKAHSDSPTKMVIIECENKPRNLYASGYIWKELTSR